jgi:hypothetical protein
MKEILLIIFGFILGIIPPWLTKKRRLKTHWCALKADIDQCKEAAETLLNEGIMSPLYRLPLIAYQVSFPVLLADGAVNEDEVLAVGRFFSLVEQINRGLDYAAEMYKVGDNARLRIEFNRNMAKAEALIKPREGSISLFDGVRQIVELKISINVWEFWKKS